MTVLFEQQNAGEKTVETTSKLLKWKEEDEEE